MDDEDAKETSFTLSVHALVVNFKGRSWCRRIEQIPQRGYSMVTKLIANEVFGNEVTGIDASLGNRLKCVSSRPTRARGGVLTGTANDSHEFLFLLVTLW